MLRKYIMVTINKDINEIYRILDDVEMYEQQNPFKISDFLVLSNFLNTFLYKAVLGNLFGIVYNFLFIFLISMLNCRFENNTNELTFSIIAYTSDVIISTGLSKNLYKLWTLAT